MVEIAIRNSSYVLLSDVQVFFPAATGCHVNGKLCDFIRDSFNAPLLPLRILSNDALVYDVVIPHLTATREWIHLFKNFIDSQSSSSSPPLSLLSSTTGIVNNGNNNNEPLQQIISPIQQNNHQKQINNNINNNSSSNSSSTPSVSMSRSSSFTSTTIPPSSSSLIPNNNNNNNNNNNTNNSVHDNAMITQTPTQPKQQQQQQQPKQQQQQQTPPVPPSPSLSTTSSSHHSISEQVLKVLWQSVELLHMNIRREEIKRLAEWRRDEPFEKQRIEAFQSQKKKIEAILQKLREKKAPTEEDVESIIQLEKALWLTEEQIGTVSCSLYFPDHQGYRLRIASNGVYTGLKDFHVELISGHFDINLTSTTSTAFESGSRNFLPQLRVVITGSSRKQQQGGLVVILELEGLCVTGMPGLPSFKADQVKAEVELVINIDIIFDRQYKCWVPRTVDLDIIRLEKEIKGGITAPDFIARNFVNLLAPYLVKKILIKNLPDSLGEYMSCFPTNNSFSGNFDINGPSLDVFTTPICASNINSNINFVVSSSVSTTTTTTTTTQSGFGADDNNNYYPTSSSASSNMNTNNYNYENNNSNNNNNNNNDSNYNTATVSAAARQLLGLTSSQCHTLSLLRSFSTEEGGTGTRFDFKTISDLVRYFRRFLEKSSEEDVESHCERWQELINCICSNKKATYAIQFRSLMERVKKLAFKQLTVSVELSQLLVDADIIGFIEMVLNYARRELHLDELDEAKKNSESNPNINNNTNNNTNKRDNGISNNNINEKQENSTSQKPKSSFLDWLQSNLKRFQSAVHFHLHGGDESSGILSLSLDYLHLHGPASVQSAIGVLLKYMNLNYNQRLSTITYADATTFAVDVFAPTSSEHLQYHMDPVALADEERLSRINEDRLFTLALEAVRITVLTDMEKALMSWMKNRTAALQAIVDRESSSSSSSSSSSTTVASSASALADNNNNNNNNQPLSNLLPSAYFSVATPPSFGNGCATMDLIEKNSDFFIFDLTIRRLGFRAPLAFFYNHVTTLLYQIIRGLPLSPEDCHRFSEFFRVGFMELFKIYLNSSNLDLIVDIHVEIFFNNNNRLILKTTKMQSTESISHVPFKFDNVILLESLIRDFKLLKAVLSGAA